MSSYMPFHTKVPAVSVLSTAQFTMLHCYNVPTCFSCNGQCLTAIHMNGKSFL